MCGEQERDEGQCVAQKDFSEADAYDKAFSMPQPRRRSRSQDLYSRQQVGNRGQQSDVGFVCSQMKQITGENGCADPDRLTPNTPQTTGGNESAHGAVHLAPSQARAVFIFSGHPL
jgi:hypothetical protein